MKATKRFSHVIPKLKCHKIPKKTQILWFLTMGTLVILFVAIFLEKGIFQQWIAPGLFCISAVVTVGKTIKEQFTNRSKNLHSC